MRKKYQSYRSLPARTGKRGGGGAAAVPFEDPLWNFKGGGRRRGRASSLALLEDPLWNFKGGGGGGAPPAPSPLNPLVNLVVIAHAWKLQATRWVLTHDNGKSVHETTDQTWRTN